MRKVFLFVALIMLTLCTGCQRNEMSSSETVLPEEQPIEASASEVSSPPQTVFSNMSTDELIAAREEIEHAIQSNKKWQEVFVPQGTYIVGQDIPVGTWTVKCADNYFRCEISWGDVLSEDGEDVDYSDRYSPFNYVDNPNHEQYKGDGLLEYTFSVEDGDYIIVHGAEGAAVFMPYTGKSDFHFFKDNEEVSPTGTSSPMLTTLSNMSFDELIALKEKINIAIWESEEWQEVFVPQGTYIVGQDIPVGTWTVKCADNYFRCEISWGDLLSEDGEDVDYSDRYSPFNYVDNPKHEWYKGDGLLEYTFSVEDGDYIIIHSAEGAAVFMPDTGKPDLGFKN